MKILPTTDWYTPAINGVVASVLNLRRGLAERGHEVRILTLSQTARSFEAGGVTFAGSCGVGFVYPGARVRVAPCAGLIRALRDWGPELVHSNCEFSTFVTARRLARRLDIPLVHTYHTVYEDYTHYFCPSKRLGALAAGAFSRRIAAQTDRLITPTAKTARLLERYGVERPISIVPTAIDQTRFCPCPEDERTRAREKFGLRGGDTVLVYVGRLAKEKNVGELLSALRDFRGGKPRLLIAGDGPVRSELTRLSHELGVDRQVVFAGMIPPEQVADCYHAADLFVSASVSETQGITYLEALSSGVPLLCRADECLDGLLKDGENGWTYSSREQFASRLSAFMENREAHETLRLGALRTSAAFSISGFAQSVEAIYLECLAHRGRQI